MKIKPFVSINFCYKCGAPVPRIGLFCRTSYGNTSVTTPFICINCKKKRGDNYDNNSRR